MIFHRTLPESELDIMLAIWRHGGPMEAPKILAALDRPLTASALHSYLKRLEEKGYLAREKVGRENRYTPLVTEEAYRRQAGRSVLEKLYGGSLKTFAAALWDGGKLSAQDVAELRDYLETLGGGEE